MIPYAQVQEAMFNPPPKPFVDIFNELGSIISRHPECINDKNPFEKLHRPGSFCISATSIQTQYIAFVLGKHRDSHFPQDIMHLFFDIDPEFQMQYAKIRGQDIDGCIYLIHQEAEGFDLEEVYTSIYA